MDTDGNLSHLLSILKQFAGIITLAFVGIGLIGVGIIQIAQTQRSDNSDIIIEKATATIEEEGGEIMVDVAGAVEKPGVYALSSDARVQDALIAAGGMLQEANRDAVSKSLNLASKVSDGMKIYIPFQGDDASPAQTGVQGSSSTLISLNNASSKELESLPGIGEVTAEKIIANRPYMSLDEVVGKGALRKSVFEKVKENISL